MRLDLGGDQWAELRSKLTYGQAHDVRVAYIGSGAGAGLADLDMAFVRAYVIEWRVLDFAGELVALDKAEAAPDEVIQKIAEQGLKLWNGKPDPKGTNGSSTTSPLVRSGNSTRKA